MACKAALLLLTPLVWAGPWEKAKVPDLQGHLARMVRDADEARGFFAKAPKGKHSSSAEAVKYVPDYVAMAKERYKTPEDAFNKMEEKSYKEGKLSPSDWNKNCDALKSKKIHSI